jgi:endonuclease/exonuclease/phosphatase family metal-dependent hydrolase
MSDAPTILDAPPDVMARLGNLASALDAIPPKQLDRNLLIGTWNLRAFGDLTTKWDVGDEDTPKRNLADVRYIAEILSRFDVVAVQEARSNLRALRYTLKVLGPSWGFTLTDVNLQAGGNGERLAFLFDTRRVTPSGLAAELVLPDTPVTSGISQPEFQRQFARSPYAVSFISAKQTFILVTLHVLWGSSPAGRKNELEAIAKWLAGWAEDSFDWGHNVIALGDFNIEGREDDPLFSAFTSTGLTSAPGLDEVPRTIFDTGATHHFYDQIAWFTDPAKGPVLNLGFEKSGSFDFPAILQGNLSKTELSWRISDHYPLWVEFSVRV